MRPIEKAHPLIGNTAYRSGRIFQVHPGHHRASAVWRFNLNLSWLRTPFLDRGRERRLVLLPLPPNRTGGFPASGSPVSGSPPRGLTQRRMGLCKREQPLRGKASIGPALMIAPTRGPATPFPALL